VLRGDPDTFNFVVYIHVYMDLLGVIEVRISLEVRIVGIPRLLTFFQELITKPLAAHDF